MRARIFLLAAFIVLGLSTVNAQNKQEDKKPRLTPVEMANKQTERMVIELKLNDKQKTEVSNINLKFFKSKDEIFTANKGKDDVIKTKMQELNRQRNAEFKKILTADQYNLMEQIAQKRAKDQKKKMAKKQAKTDSLIDKKVK